MQEILKEEAKKLTDIGNGKRNNSHTGLAIRHHETNKIVIDNHEHIDFLFYRMASFMTIILKHLGKSNDVK